MAKDFPVRKQVFKLKKDQRKFKQQSPRFNKDHTMILQDIMGVENRKDAKNHFAFKIPERLLGPGLLGLVRVLPNP